jgi:hypothetical protein
MVKFTATILQFAEQGEKTGWMYIEVPEKIAQQIKPNNKKSFRVKGKLDNYIIKGVALLPMGSGNFIIAFNAAMRKGSNKRKNDVIHVQLEEDTKGYELDLDFVACLQEEPLALTYFNTLTKGHRNYFSKWIESAKTIDTKSKRIALAINALVRHMGYPEMIREQTEKNKRLKGM